MNGFTIKLIAVISMLIDHAGAIFFPQYIILRYIGRLAFPIYAFFISEGFSNTSNVKKYLINLFAFGLVSEIPFDFAFYKQFIYWGYQNVFFTLFIGLLVIYIYDSLDENNYILKVLSVVLGSMIASFLKTDYGYKGVLMVFLFYIAKKYSDKLVNILSKLGILILNFGHIQVFAVLALIPISFYNGKRGKKTKIIFYIIYPLHLALFGVVNYVKSMGTF